MRTFKVNDIVVLRHKHLYWVQQGSHTLNAVVDSTSDEAERILRARVLKIQVAPNWGNLLFLAVEGQNAPEGCALVAKCTSCERVV